MKIVIVWEFLPPETYGVAFQIRGLAFAKHLKVMGHDVVLMGPKKKGVTASLDEVRRIEFSSTHMSLASFPEGLFKVIGFGNALAEKLRTEEPDIVLVSAHSPQLMLECVYACRRTGIKLIMDVQDSWLVLGYDKPGSKAVKLKQMLERLALAQADRVVVISETLKRMVAHDYSIPLKKIGVVYNGADLDKMEGSKELERDLDLIHVGSPRVIYDDYGLLHAFSLIQKELPGITLTYLGWEDNDFTKKMLKSVREFGEYIKIVPQVPHSEVREWLSRAKVGMHSFAQKELFRCALGVKVFEYMAAGLPVAHLGPGGSEMKRLVKGKGVGVFAQEPEDLANGVVELLQNQESWAECSQRALEVAKEYDWQRLTEKLFEENLKSVAWKGD